MNPLNRSKNRAWWAFGARTFLRSRSGRIARLLRHPTPGSRPWRRRHLEVARRGGLGDTLLCTPVLRELKRKNPACRVRFYTNYPDLVRGLPYIDQVLAFEERPKDAIFLQYEDAIPPREHLARIIGDNLGIEVRDVRPDCVINLPLVASTRRSWHRLRRPHIIVQRRGSRWTPNKEWPHDLWADLIGRLSQRGTVLEIGMKSSDPPIALENYVDVRGRSLEEFVAQIAAADILVGPASGPSHIAAAAGTPAVIIMSGYELPINSSYSTSTCLHKSVACSPCWLREPCPYGLKCLTAIQPEAVEAAVCEALVKYERTSRSMSEIAIQH